MRKKNNIVLIIFSYLGFLIGAGVATGQEIFQYYTVNGYWMIGTGFIIALILVISNYCYSFSAKNNIDDCNNAFEFYFGKKIGSAIDWFCTIFCFLTFIIMISGGSSTLQQQYSLPIQIGVVIIAILAFFSVISGLLKLVKIIGYITPFIIIAITIISILNILNNINSIPDNINLINEGSLNVMRAGNYWWLAGISNGGFCILMLSKYTFQLSKNNSLKSITISSVISSIILVILNITIGFSLLASAPAIVNSQIPNLIIFEQIAPILGPVFGLFIFIALYTSATPLLWTVTTKFSKETDSKYILITSIFTILAVIASLIFDFSWLINNIYTYSGYVGFAILICMIIKYILIQLKKFKNKKRL